MTMRKNLFWCNSVGLSVEMILLSVFEIWNKNLIIGMWKLANNIYLKICIRILIWKLSHFFFLIKGNLLRMKHHWAFVNNFPSSLSAFLIWRIRHTFVQFVCLLAICNFPIWCLKLLFAFIFAIFAIFASNPIRFSSTIL